MAKRLRPINSVSAQPSRLTLLEVRPQFARRHLALLPAIPAPAPHERVGDGIVGMPNRGLGTPPRRGREREKRDSKTSRQPATATRLASQPLPRPEYLGSE